MGYIFVKSTYNAKTTGTKQNGVFLEYEKNAFKTMEDVAAYSDLSEEDIVVVLDSKVSLDNVTLENKIVTAYDENPAKTNLTAKGSLVVEGSTTGWLGYAEDEVDGDEVTPSIGFNELTISDSQVAGAWGGKFSQAETEEVDYDKDIEKNTFSASQSAAGKLLVEKEATVGAVIGYSKVDISNSDVASVNGATIKQNYKFDKKENIEKESEDYSFASAGTFNAVNANVVNVTGYANVNLEGGTYGDIEGGSGKETSTSNEDTDKGILSEKETVSFTSTGKFVAKDVESIGEIDGYANVQIKDVDEVANIYAGNETYSSTTASNDEKETFSTNVSETEKAAGTLVIESSTVTGEIDGFANVTLKEATVASIDAENTVYSRVENDDTKKYSLKVTETTSSAGKLTVEDGSTIAGEVEGFANVALEDVTLDGASFVKTDSTTTTQTSKDKVNETGSTVITTTNKLGGTATFKEVAGEDATVTGYAKVIVEKSTLAAISNETISKSVTKQDYFEEVVSHDFKAANNGSVEVKQSTVGDIAGYKTVVVSGTSSTQSVAGNIIGGVTELSWADNVAEKITDDGTNYSGNATFNSKVTVDGTVKVTDATVASIDGYKDVALKNATVTGSVNGNVGDEDGLNVDKETYTVKTAKKTDKDSEGNKITWLETTVSSTENEVVEKGGKFTAENSSFAGLNGFSDVKLTNVGSEADIVGKLTETETLKETVVGKSENFDIDDMSISDAISFKRSFTETTKSVGSFEFDIKGKSEDSYTLANITNFNKVTIAGVDNTYKKVDAETYNITKQGVNVVVGNIQDAANVTETDTWDFTADNNKDKGDQYSGTYKETSTITGSVKIGANVAAGDIISYKNVVVTGSISPIDGTYSTSVGNILSEHDDTISITESFKSQYSLDKDGDRDELVSVDGKYVKTGTEKATGSLTITAAEVKEEIDDFNKVVLKDALVTGSVNGGNNNTDKDTANVTTDKKGNVVLTQTWDDVENATASFTATNSTVEGEYGVEDFAKVSLVDTSVTGITMAVNKTSSEKITFEYDLDGFMSDYDQAEDLSEVTGESADSFTYERKSATTIVGTVSASITAAKAAKLWKDDEAESKNISVGSISDAKTVTLTGIVNDAKKNQISYIEAGDIVANGDVKYVESCDGDEVTAQQTITSVGSITAKYAKTGSIVGYTKVSLTNSEVDGSILGGTSLVKFESKVDEFEDADPVYMESKVAGSLTAVNTDITGDIQGFATVNLTDGSANIINGSNYINDDGKEQFTAAANLNLTGSSVEAIQYFKSANVANSLVGTVEEVSKFNVTSGFVAVGEYLGSEDDETITIAKGAAFTAGAFGEEFGKGDKLVINGTFIIGDEMDYETALDLASGSGVIAANKGIYDIIVKEYDDFGGSFLNLGNTSEGFRGEIYENADNTLKSAVAVDITGEAGYTGWLAAADAEEGAIAFTDNEDYLKLTITEADSELVIDCDADFEAKLTLNGKVIEDYSALAAGEYILHISLGKEASNSTSYNVSIATLS